MKKNIAILTLALLLATVAKAQIYVTEGDDNLRDPAQPTAIWPALPNDSNLGNDGYTPLGSGIALLSALGGAYLIGKRKGLKKENK